MNAVPAVVVEFTNVVDFFAKAFIVEPTPRHFYFEMKNERGQSRVKERR